MRGGARSPLLLLGDGILAEVAVAQSIQILQRFLRVGTGREEAGVVQVQAVQISPQHDESVTVPFATGSVDNSFIIDTLAPSLVNASVTASGDHGNARAGDRILLTVQASEALTLVNLDPRNPPSLTLDFGAGGTRTAIYDAAASASASRRCVSVLVGA